eukprot:TRINITY_DN8939_c0_g8_i1.p1 TRINITY_DN8939_c0_g8~~TRINITY_DN8939_c0_g8_i1.p1  ORF type:complete len:930 (-),score=262.85 TRINITY_DN8939_c0_g8_i1:239-3028(-)
MSTAPGDADIVRPPDDEKLLVVNVEQDEPKDGRGEKATPAADLRKAADTKEPSVLLTSTLPSKDGEALPPSPRSSGSKTVDGATPKSTAARKTVKQHAMTGKTLAQMQMSQKWYRSERAQTIRSNLQGKTFAIMMLFALLAALFVPDCGVLAGVSNSFWVDVILTLIMVMFTAELILMSALDAEYFLGFFFWMDILGTVSLIFDIDYMLGPSASEPQKLDDSDAKRNFMLLRAARAAKVGARAGRLSRIVRLLRFLPFLKSRSMVDKQNVGIASVISGQLANVLATRVACLTIILFMVIPLFDLPTFPQNDHSLQAWTERLAAQLSRNRTQQASAEMRKMVDFFDTQTYGPYEACVGKRSTGDFTCGMQEEQPPFILDARYTMAAPPRGASQMIVETDSLRITFNMHQPKVLEAGLSMATICFIIIIMMFSGMAFSSVVTELAVRPLEKMLANVRNIATTVFNFAATNNDTADEEEATDIASSSEMKLLEKVVAKLAIIADLQTRHKMRATEDMCDEDRGVLGLIQGNESTDQTPTAAMLRQSVSAKKHHGLTPTNVGPGVQIRLEDCSLSSAEYNSFGFAALPLTRAQRINVSVYTVARFADTGEGFITNAEDESRLTRFVTAVEKDYMPNPFHNFAHAVDVSHSVSRMLKLMESEAFLNPLEQFSLLIAGLGHDLGHPGVNNGFLTEVRHELALQYNDKSPLENMHCSKLYLILQVPDTNLFANLSREQYKESRKVIVESILHTDMVGHTQMIKDLQMCYQVNSEIFRSPPSAEGNTMVEQQVFEEQETKMLTMECILHSADVSNPCRRFDVTEQWAHRCLEEFFAQGDQEKLLGIPVQFLNDKDKINRPNSQIGFIEFAIAPFFCAQIKLWPKLSEYGDHCATNMSRWAEAWTQEVNPCAEEATKVNARVSRTRQNMEDAKARATS